MSGIICKPLQNNQLNWVFDQSNYNAASPPGVYTFTYRVSVNAVVSDTFTFNLELIDSCLAENLTITKPVIAPYEYYITAPTVDDSEFLAPKFSVSPAWCESTLQFSAPPALFNFISWDQAAQRIDYTAITDSLVLSGPIDDTNPNLEKVYRVTLTFTVSDFAGDEVATVVNYDVIIKNPCINQQIVQIQGVTRQNLDYFVGTGEASQSTGAPYTV